MNKFIWCLNTEKGYQVLKKIHNDYFENIGLICSYPEWNVKENYGQSIANYCISNNIQYIQWDALKSDLEHYIKKNNISGIIAIGWQFLIPLEYNTILDNKIIVFHDSLLPKYRGFCPLATAILKGENEIGVSVIYASEGIDEGEIILQKKANIDNVAYLKDAINLISHLYYEGVEDLLFMINSNTITSHKQKQSEATYCLWRDPNDQKIDWNDSATNIYNLIRASGPPYLGAYTQLKNKTIRIWKASVQENDINFEIRNPGKIWNLENGKPVVVCGKGLLKIISATYEDGTNAVPIQKLRQRFGAED